MDGLADVPVDAPALPHSGDDGGEVVVGEHHIRRGFGHLGAVFAHGAADVGGLQGRGVVDAVAGHGHHHPPALEGLYQPHLVLRGHPGEHRRVEGLPGQGLVGEAVQLRAGHHLAFPAGDAHPPGDGQRRGPVVPGDHHRQDARPLTLGHRGLYPGPGRVLHGDEAAEHQAALHLPVLAGEAVHVPVGHGQHPQGLLRQAAVVGEEPGFQRAAEGFCRPSPAQVGTTGQ